MESYIQRALYYTYLNLINTIMMQSIDYYLSPHLSKLLKSKLIGRGSFKNFENPCL